MGECVSIGLCFSGVRCRIGVDDAEGGLMAPMGNFMIHDERLREIYIPAA